MDNMQTIDLILAMKDLKQKANVRIREAEKDLHEAEGILLAVREMEKEFEGQIEAYKKSRNTNN